MSIDAANDLTSITNYSGNIITFAQDNVYNGNGIPLLNEIGEIMGTTPLEAACQTGNLKMVKLLVAHGAKPTEDPQWREVAVKLLQKYQADFHIKDDSGKTAYDYAVEDG